MTRVNASARARWERLVEREAAGEELSEEERHFVQSLAEADTACAVELGLIRQLKTWDGGAEAEADSATCVEFESAVGKLLAGARSRAIAERAAAVTADRPAQAASRRRARWAWGAASAALAVAAGLVVFWPGQAPLLPSEAARSQLVYAAGEVTVNGTPHWGDRNLRSKGSEIRTADGQACVHIDPGIDLCLGSHSRLVFRATRGPHRRLELLQGRVAASLETLPADQRFSIVAAGIWSTAAGTTFAVEMNPGNEEVVTSVLEGKVRVTGGFTQRSEAPAITLRANWRARSSTAASALSTQSGRKSRVSPVPHAEAARVWGALKYRTLWSGDRTSRIWLELSAQDALTAGTRVSLNGMWLGVPPLFVVVPSGAHEVQLGRDVGGGRTELHASCRVQTRAGQQVRLDEHDFSPVEEARVEQAPDTTSRGLTGVDVGLQGPRSSTQQERRHQVVRRAQEPALADRARSARQALVQQAHRQMRTRHWAAAAATYRRLRREFPRSAEARIALLSLAQLELDHLGKPESAHRHLTQYLKGGGQLTREAHFAQIRVLRRLGWTDKERRALEVFLRRYPDSVQTQALRARRDELTSSR